MDLDLKDRFLDLWGKYFDSSELPITFFYTDDVGGAELVPAPSAHQCLIGALAKVRKGFDQYFEKDSIGCAGGKRYVGFSKEIMPDFEYFLSCGIPNSLEGERYKKTPELVKESMKYIPRYEAPARFIVFKRWERLERSDNPAVVVFFAKPDVLSGLFTLVNFDEAEPNGVVAPFCAGCGSIVQYPYIENRSKRPRAVIGMFDISARPHVQRDVLTMAIPMKKFIPMLNNMEESFLITESWRLVQKRLR
jgi:uncharacterized protein (DUF169 family)